MISRLRRRFVAIAMLSVILVLGILIGTINAINFCNLVKDADETIQSIIEHNGVLPLTDKAPEFLAPEAEGGSRERIHENRSDPFGFGDRRDMMEEMPFQTRFFTVSYGADGNVVSYNLERIALDEVRAGELAETVYNSRKAKGFLSGYRYVSACEESGTLLVFLNLRRELSTFQSFLYSSLLISLIGIIAVFVLIMLLSARIVRPMAQSYEKQKRFITDAGHELKTPITIINADVDVLEMENESSEWLSDIRTQATRLSALTNDLIYLSRMEEDTPRIRMTAFPLSEVVEEIVSSFAAVAKTSDKQLAVAIQPMLSIKGDQKSIEKLISILMDNALKYTPVHGNIRFTLQKVTNRIQLVVFNSAENVKKGNCDHYFDRFYRADSSRNSEQGGFGLGLAVAKAVTEAHKGKIRAYSEDGASLTIEVVFPDA